jgi:hypothetical protein
MQYDPNQDMSSYLTPIVSPRENVLNLLRQSCHTHADGIIEHVKDGKAGKLFKKLLD